ncbi:MAG TPA: DUF423 domain-containing protein [Cyclobacteriaceae bacterium]|nr:DUF423 domain-containing protein [Cyclobacteriaceae bacterium]
MMGLQKKLIMLGALMGGFSVALGAFGAHALKGILLAHGRAGTYELAVTYQFYHALALLALAALADKLNAQKASWSALAFVSGTLVFSGSLYILSLSGNTLWGAVTPVGGVLLLTGWLFFLLSARK